MTRQDAQELARHLQASAVGLRSLHDCSPESYFVLADHLLTLAGKIERRIDDGGFPECES